MSKRIGLMIPNLQSGGAERVLTKISHILADYGYEIYFFVFGNTGISYNYAGELICLNCPSRKTFIAKVLNFAKRIILVTYYKKRLNLDIMISFLISSNKVNIYASGKTKRIISCRGYSDYSTKKSFYAKYIRKIHRIYFPIQQMTDEFIDEYQVSPSKIVTIENSYDTASIANMMKEPVSDEFLDFTTGKKILITVGSFKRDKGYWHLLKSFEEVYSKYKEVCLVFIGHRGEMQSEIINMAHSSIAKDNILFLGYDSNPFKYLAKSDIFLCSSLNEGFPNSLVEAMCCGCAIVSTDCKTGPSEILANAKYAGISTYLQANYGILTATFDSNIDFDITNKSNSHQNYADAILCLLEQEYLLLEYKQLAKKRSSNFDDASFRDKILSLIEHI